MDSRVESLVSQETWTLVPGPTNANIFMCKWVFTLKYHPDDTIARHLASLVTCGFTQMYDINNTKLFYVVVCLHSVLVLLSLIVNQAWSLHQLDVSNTFHYGDSRYDLVRSLKHKIVCQTKFIIPNSR